MTYSQYFETGVARSGARFIARWDGEYCGEHDTEKAARAAIAAREKAEKAAIALDKVARPFFCDGRYGVWRAVEQGQALAPETERAFNAHHNAAMAFARIRGLD